MEIFEGGVDGNLQSPRVAPRNLGFEGLNGLLARPSIQVPLGEVEIIFGASLGEPNIATTRLIRVLYIFDPSSVQEKSLAMLTILQFSPDEVPPDLVLK